LSTSPSSTFSICQQYKTATSKRTFCLHKKIGVWQVFIHFLAHQQSGYTATNPTRPLASYGILLRRGGGKPSFLHAGKAGPRQPPADPPAAGSPPGSPPRAPAPPAPSPQRALLRSAFSAPSANANRWPVPPQTLLVRKPFRSSLCSPGFLLPLEPPHRLQFSHFNLLRRHYLRYLRTLPAL